jgi:Flp pilus assembly protein TadD
MIVRPVSATGKACLFMLPLLASLNGCAQFDAFIGRRAAQNEATLRQQQEEQKKPVLGNGQVYLEMIRKLQENSLYFASLAHLDAYQKTYGSSPEMRRMRADALRQTGDAAAAQTLYRQLLSSTEAARAWHGLGLLAAQRGDYTAAVNGFREANRHDPIDAAVLSDLAYALLRSGEHKAAWLPLMKAAELAPDNHRVIGNLALFLLLTGEAGKAEEMMNKANIPAHAQAEVLRQAKKISAKETPLPLPENVVGENAATVTDATDADRKGSGLLLPMPERLRRAFYLERVTME